MKRCQQISKCNGCSASFDKTDKKIYVLGGNALEWHGKGSFINKQYKIRQKNPCYCTKISSLLICRPYLEVKVVQTLSKSDFLEEIKKGIIIGSGIKAV